MTTDEYCNICGVNEVAFKTHTKTETYTQLLRRGEPKNPELNLPVLWKVIDSNRTDIYQHTNHYCVECYMKEQETDKVQEKTERRESFIPHPLCVNPEQ